MLDNWQRKFDEEGILDLGIKRRGCPSKMKRNHRKVKQDNHAPLNEDERKELE